MSKVPSIRLNRKSFRPRNSFDVSERSLYSQPVGAIIPTFVRDLNPGDHLEVNIASLLQAQTLKGRAFFSGKQKFAGFFVPYKQLWSGWESFITGLRPSLTMSSTAFLNGSRVPLVTRSSEREYSVDDGSLYGSLPKFKPFDILKSLNKLKDKDNPYLKDVHGVSYFNNYVRLLDLLGYGNVLPLKLKDGTRIGMFGNPTTGTPVVINDDNYGSLPTLTCNLFRFAAYQKIYQDYFLDDTFEFRNPFAYSLDYLSSNFGAGLISASGIKDKIDNYWIDKASAIFQIRYAHYEKDYLSNLIPYQLDMSNFSSLATLPSYDNPDFTNGMVTVSSNNESPLVSSSATVNVANIRAAFALDKLLQVSSRAGKSYKEQIRAHYGEDVSNTIDACYYCGGFDKRLDVNAVVATAAGSPTSDGADASFLGQQSGFIDSASRGQITCDAKDFGVFMIVSYVTVEPRYDVYIDPFILKQTSADFFHPEFEDLGLQPVYRYNYGLSTTDDLNKVLSWQPRYSEYKSSFNRLHGEFSRNGSLSFLSPYKRFNIHNEKRAFDSPMFLISPKSIDNTLEVVYDGNQYTDPFRVESHFAASLVSNMSVSGLAKLI